MKDILYQPGKFSRENWTIFHFSHQAKKEGLTGKFDFTLEFAPEPPGALSPPRSVEGLSDNTDTSGPNLITAVQQQLGLKLNPSKVPLDVLIIDRVDQVPTEN
jgi:bla regulator protein blaR1